MNDFNVTQIQMVAIIPSAKRDKKHQQEQNLTHTEATGFAAELDKAMDALAPQEVHTITYNAKSQLQPFYYTSLNRYSV